MSPHSSLAVSMPTMNNLLDGHLSHRLAKTVLILCLVILAGTTGFWFIAGEDASLVDSLYMTVITVTTIGFGEVIDLSGNPGGRFFTILLALAGIGTLSYFLTNLTAFIVEGELKDTFWRKKMEKQASRLRGHYIVCGVGNLGVSILNELHSTGRPYLIVDQDRLRLERLDDELRNAVLIEGDAMDGETLERAGLAEAKGLFAVTGDDNHNLVVVLTAKQANPAVKVVAECANPKNMEKMKLAGADSVVSPSRIGGLRMASEMIRPAVVSFLDQMLREENGHLRIEEVHMRETTASLTVEQLHLRDYPSLLLLGVRRQGEILYNPPADSPIQRDDILIFMGTPADRTKLERALQSPA